MTVLSGNGGAGKGTLAAWLAARVTTELDGIVLVIDSEGHPDEWYERVRGAGGRLDGIVHATHTGGLLDLDLFHGYAAGLLRLVVVDSAGYFTDREGDRWGPGAATAMQAALARTGVPSLVLAHQSRQGGGTEAYGSVFWHNVPRARYSLDRMDDGSRVLTCRKGTGLQGITEGDAWDVNAQEDDDGVPVITGLEPRGRLMVRTAKDVGTDMLRAGWLSTTDLALRAGASAQSWHKWAQEMGCRTREVPTGGRPRIEYTLRDDAP